VPPYGVFDFVLNVIADFYGKWNLDESVYTEPVQAKDDELDFFLHTELPSKYRIVPPVTNRRIYRH